MHFDAGNFKAAGALSVRAESVCYFNKLQHVESSLQYNQPWNRYLINIYFYIFNSQMKLV